MANTNEIAQIDAINKGLNSLNDTLNKTATSYLTLVKSIETGNQTIKNNALSFENLDKAQKSTTETSKQLDAVGKQLEASEKKLKETEDSRIKTIIENRVATQAATQSIKDKIKAEQAEEGSLVRMRAQLKELTLEYDKTGQRTKAAAEEIDKLSREIGKAEAATNRHQRGVGGYADQLGKLPGPISGVISGLMSFSKTLWLLVANPIGAVIAAIVAAFAALGAVFSSTASGAKLIKEVMASLGAIFDVIIERTMVVIDAFKMLFSGEFRKAADLFSKSVEGAGKQMDEAARAAWNLVEVQSQLNKELTFHVSESAKENNEFQKALFLSKDRTKSDQERLGTLKQALTVSEEMAKKEVEFAKRQYIIDTDKAALKAKTSGVTSDQLRAFIELNTEEQKTALAGSAALQDMWNKLGGSDKFKPLEESYAKVIDADTEFFQKNKRTLSQMSTLQNELAKEREDRLKEQTEKEQKAVDAYVKGMNTQIEANEKELKSKLDAIDKEDKENEDLRKSTIDGFNEELDDFVKAEDEKTKKAKEEADKRKKLEEDIKQAKIDLAIEAGNAVFSLRNMAFEKELNDLDRRKEKELSNKNLTEAQKAKIEADYQKKANEIKKKQAVNDKLQALFNIAINTAVGIMKAAPAVPLMALVAAIGAIQAGLVAAQPIPKFAKGTKSAPERGIFGEAGRELMALRSGELMMADKATFFEGDRFKGAKIYSNPETERMMSMVADRNIVVRNQTDERIVAGLEKLNNTIRNKPVNIIDSEHRIIGQKMSNHQEFYMNRLINRNS